MYLFIYLFIYSFIYLFLLLLGRWHCRCFQRRQDKKAHIQIHTNLFVINLIIPDLALHRYSTHMHAGVSLECILKKFNEDSSLLFMLVWHTFTLASHVVDLLLVLYKYTWSVKHIKYASLIRYIFICHICVSYIQL